jgi:SAM-dependent methyltransferase
MLRTIQPELLDTLSPQHPDAQQNRRDLRLTNQITGTHRWIARALPALLHDDERALEIGAGTGELAALLSHRGVAVDGLDLWPAPANWPASRQWHRDDVRSFAHFDDYDAIVGNLIFHQFHAHELAALGAGWNQSRVRVVVAAEPARRRMSQTLYRTLGPCFGANHVSLHDAHASIAAGFVGDELARFLGFPPAMWSVRCSTTLLGIYRFVAVRRA